MASQSNEQVSKHSSGTLNYICHSKSTPKALQPLYFKQKYRASLNWIYIYMFKHKLFFLDEILKKFYTLKWRDEKWVLGINNGVCRCSADNDNINEFGIIVRKIKMKMKK